MSVIRHHSEAGGRLLRLLCGLGVALMFSVMGCSALNPEAVEIIFPADTAEKISGGTTLENAPGHVPIFLINTTTFNENLLDYMRSRGVTIPYDPDIRPRVRFRVQVLFASGAEQIFEFLDGSEVFDGVVTYVDENGATVTENADKPPELTDDTLTNSVVLCDVAEVGPLFEITSTTSSIEVFVPTFVEVFRRDIRPDGTSALIHDSVEAPQFRPLLVDEVNETGAVILQRNFGTREIPAVPRNLTCGSVVVFVLRGELNLPFIIDAQGSNVPGYVDTDEARQAAIPGRYELSVTVR